MNLERKLAALVAIYRIYEEFVGRFRLACEKNCASCCTCNVTATTLEAYYLLENVATENGGRLSETEIGNRIATAPGQRFRPALTFNRIAALCAKGEEIPDEHCDPSWGRCPFLENEQCVFYLNRPFGCRCMSSLNRCSETGFAEMPPLMMSVNDVFMQVVEHLDEDGFSGNLTDVLEWMSDESNRGKYEKGARREDAKRLAPNSPMPALMVPPEHRKLVEPIWVALRKAAMGVGQ